MDWSAATRRVRTLAAHRVCAALRGLSAPPDVAVVGGTVRDLLLDRPHPDLDLCVAADPREVASALKASLGGSWFVLDETFEVVRFTGSAGEIVDMARRQGATWEEDLERRDLTINALGTVLAEAGRPVPELAVLDPTGGLADLRDGIIRATGPGALEADPLRALRVFRFAGALGFEIDGETRRLAAEAGKRLGGVSWERIRDEVFKLLTAPVCGPYVGGLADSRLLEIVLPELSWLRGTVSTGHFDGFAHRLEALRALDTSLSTRGPWTPAEREFLTAVLARSLSGGRTTLALARAALLAHGLETFRPEGDRGGGAGSGEIAAGGAGSGGEIAADSTGGKKRGGSIAAIAGRLRLANPEVRWLQGADRGLAEFAALRMAPRIGGAALYRFFRVAGDAAAAVAVLGLADFQAARDLTLEDDEGVLALSRRILAEAMAPTVTAPRAPLVRGDDLIAALCLDRGPQVARLLEEIAQARAEGSIATPGEALEFARARLGTSPDSRETGTIAADSGDQDRSLPRPSSDR